VAGDFQHPWRDVDGGDVGSQLRKANTVESGATPDVERCFASDNAKVPEDEVLSKLVDVRAQRVAYQLSYVSALLSNNGSSAMSGLLE